MDAARHLAAELGVVGFADRAHAVFGERLVEEAGPFVENGDFFVGHVGEAPDLVGLVGAGVVPVADGFEEGDDALDEGGGKDADGAEVEQIDRGIGADLVVAEMGVSVNDAVAVERHIPGLEERGGDGVAFGLRRVFGAAGHQGPAVEPGHRQEAFGGDGFDRGGDVDFRGIVEHGVVEAHLRGFARVVELLAQAFGEFGVDVVVLDGAVDAVVDGHGEFELAQVGFDGGGHVGVLQLAGDIGAVGQGGAVDLAEGGGGDGVLGEAGEAGLPGRAEFGLHAAADEGPAHGRRVGLQRGEFGGVFGGQGVGDGGEQLRDLHHRALEAAENGFEVFGVIGAVGFEAEGTFADHARGDAADGAGGAGHAAEFAEKGGTVFGHAVVSSSSMKPEMTSRPLRQNPGSEASRPKGARRSRWRLVPPARSMSRYLRWKPGWPDWKTA